MLQATLTLPGIAAIALTLGMAIDANVLINERIREELRWGATPHAAIQAGYERAWGTILDSNVTTLIAGIALFIFGSGPVRGFAVVHCLGILTSMFSRGVRLARHRQPDLRQPQEARQDLDRPGLAAAGRHAATRRRHSTRRASRPTLAAARPHRSSTMEFFRIQRDIPFMRHALMFNVISLVTFVLAVVFLATRGLNFGVDFRGGTVIEVTYAHAGRLQPHARRDRQAEPRRVLGAELRQLRHRADPPAAQGRRVERAAVRARDGRAAAPTTRRPRSSASSSSARRSARSSTRTARSRCCWSRSASSATSRCASSGASRSPRSSPTCTTSSSSSASSRCSSGSSRCRCWRRCSRCSATR